MRPQILGPYTPATVSTTTYGSGFTGAGPFTMTTPGGPADGLAHFVSLASTANLSAINMTITGTDADGNAQTEVLAGPNNNTVTSVKYFVRVTTISAASTLGANTMDVGFLAGACSKTLPLDRTAVTFNVGLMVDVSGTINYTVQYTLQDVFAGSFPSTLTWLNNAAPMASATADQASNYSAPVMATRFILTSYTSTATIRYDVLQGRSS